MQHSIFYKSVIIFLSFLSIASCGNRGSSQKDGGDASNISPNSVYYWKTRFAINEEESSFLKANSIERIYLRLFDVGVEDGCAIPIATTSFESAKPAGIEIVPVVFITVRALECAKDEKGGLEEFARKIETRVMNMCDYNDLGLVRELQLDCDWTASTREDYYALCREVRAILRAKGIALSSTIRLHQLRQSAPPVDRGVLMLYNTGSFRDPGADNSILSKKDASAYLKGNKPVKYGIPLDFAYPAFSWGVWFRDNTFMTLLHTSDYADADLYRQCDDGCFEVVKDHVLEGHQLQTLDRIRVEHPSFKEIQSVKALVAKGFPGGEHRNIIYHLDSNNLKDYTADEIKSIFDN